jgi:chemotaxis protein methyltransferase CheR
LEHEYELSETDFIRIRDMIYSQTRIDLKGDKKALIQSRLNKRLRALGIPDYRAYLKYVKNDESGRELVTLVDSLTTNLTYFFREPDHFDFIRDDVLDGVSEASGARLRFWSAGCSSGEEAYTLAIVLREKLPAIDIMDARILATDVSTRMLAAARDGIFNHDKFRDMPLELKQKYFSPVARNNEKLFQAAPELKRLIRFNQLNLFEPWPMKIPFDVILCRNVMIYFDRKTQQELIDKFHKQLRPGGHLIVGHSESLTGVRHEFTFAQKTIYKKPD